MPTRFGDRSLRYGEVDRRYMVLAIAEARADPRRFKVGAVIVTPSGDLVTAHGGEDVDGKEHAEHCAIRKCLSSELDLTDATLYTTLEPCVEHARSPGDIPCAVEVLSTEIGRVVVGITDTDSRVRKRGTHKLRAGGIDVVDCTDVDLRREIKVLMKPFLQQERPPFYANYPAPTGDTFVGRTEERLLLGSWLCRQGELGHFPILTLHGLGGAGKSTLAWLWANMDVAGIELPLPVAASDGTSGACSIDRGWRVGLSVLWFSFYPADRAVTFERFLEVAIEHCSGGDFSVEDYVMDEVIDYDELARGLLDVLTSRRCLVIWDGAERLLWEYDAPTSLHDLSETPPHEAFPGSRACIEPRIGRFLQGLTSQTLSKILIVSRVPFADLEGYAAGEIPLGGLDPAAAVELLRRRGVDGTTALLQQKAGNYEYHPLSVSNLAAAVTGDYRARGDIRDAPSFDPGAPVDTRRRHVLERAFGNRLPELQQLLSRLAAVRGEITHPTVEHLATDIKALDLDALSRGLAELSRHGLLRITSNGESFDMHPLVRGYAYERLLDKRETHQRLAAEAEDCAPLLAKGRSVDDTWVDSAVRFFYHTARSGQYMEAWEFFKAEEDAGGRNLNHVLFNELSNNWTVRELLTELFPNGRQEEPVVDTGSVVPVLNDLALAYLSIGGIVPARRLLTRAVDSAHRILREHGGHPANFQGATRGLALALESLAEVEITMGALRQARDHIAQSMATYLLSDQSWQVVFPARTLGHLLSILGRHAEFESHIGGLRSIADTVSPGEYVYDLLLAEDWLAQGDADSAANHAKTARRRFDQLPIDQHFARMGTWLTCIEGEVALALGELPSAEERFAAARRDAGRSGLIELEVRAKLGSAGVDVARSSDPQEAQKDQRARDAYVLAQTAQADAERCEMVLLNADAHIVLAKLAKHDSDRAGLRAHATVAKDLASCGLTRPRRGSFYYARAYREARELLREAG